MGESRQCSGRHKKHVVSRFAVFNYVYAKHAAFMVSSNHSNSLFAVFSIFGARVRWVVFTFKPCQKPPKKSLLCYIEHLLLAEPSKPAHPLWLLRAACLHLPQLGYTPGVLLHQLPLHRSTKVFLRTRHRHHTGTASRENAYQTGLPVCVNR